MLSKVGLRLRAKVTGEARKAGPKFRQYDLTRFTKAKISNLESRGQKSVLPHDLQLSPPLKAVNAKWLRLRIAKSKALGAGR